MPLHGRIERRRRRSQLFVVFALNTETMETEDVMMFIQETEPHVPITRERLHEISTRCDDECCICLECEDSLKLPCGHVIHEECAIQWFESSNTCPVCRIEIE